MKRTVHKLAVLAALFFGTGLATLVWEYRNLEKWEGIPARVLFSELVPFQAGGKTRYRGEVELRYMVKDLFYEVPYSVPTTNKSLEAARDDLMRYKVGATTTVYVNPNDPLDFLVERKSSMRFFLLPGALIAAGTVLGFMCVLLFLSMQRWLCPGCANSVALHHKFCFACGRSLPRARKLVRA